MSEKERRKPKRTLWVRRQMNPRAIGPGPDAYNFVIERAQNIIRPLVGDVLTPGEVQSLINADVTVNIS